MLAFAYFGCIALVLVYTVGHYSLDHLFTLFGLHVAFSITSLCSPDDELKKRTRNRLFAVLFLLFTIVLAGQPNLRFEVEGDALSQLQITLRFFPILAGMTLVALQLAPSKPVRVGTIAILTTAVLLLVAARVLVVMVVEDPHIDVFTTSQEAVAYLSAGNNPYAQSYQDIYRGAYNYQPAFVYWPGWLDWSMLWHRVFGIDDVRFGLAIAEGVAAFCIVGLVVRLRQGWTAALLAAALWLSFPVGLMIIWKSWSDPLLVMSIAAAAWATAARRPLLAGIFVGCAFATKQYAVIATAFWMIYVLRAWGWRPLFRFLGGFAVSAGLLLVPFIVWDWPAFKALTIVKVLTYLPRDDALTVPAYFLQMYAEDDVEGIRWLYKVFGYMWMLITAALLVWSFLTKRRPTLWRLFGTIATSYGFMLLFASQAFCNYYYFLAFFVFLTLLARWSPDGPNRAHR